MFRAPSGRLPYPVILPLPTPITWDGFPGTGYMWLSGGVTIPNVYVDGGNVYVDARKINHVVARATGLYVAGGPQQVFDTGILITNVTPLTSSSPVITDDFINSLGTTVLDTTGWTKFYIETSIGLAYSDSPGYAVNFTGMATYLYNWP